MKGASNDRGQYLRCEDQLSKLIEEARPSKSRTGVAAARNYHVDYSAAASSMSLESWVFASQILTTVIRKLLSFICLV